MSFKIKYLSMATMQSFVLISVCMSVIAPCSGATAADIKSNPYPTKPIRFVVPFAPGGGTDLIARTIAPKLSEALGQAVVVDNRGGAGGVLGADVVAKAPADGYTMVIGTPGPLTINPSLLPRMPYSLADFAPITQATVSPFVLVVNPSVAAKSVTELIALAKAKPNSINFGSAGNGSMPHLASEHFKALANIQITHIPYKGSGPALVELLGGQLQMVIDNLPTVWPQIKLGKLRPLGVSTKKRSSLVPDYPTLSESGVSGYDLSTASGLLVPAKTPRAIIARLNQETVAILRNTQVKERLLSLGLEAEGGTPEQYTKHLQDEFSVHAKVIKNAGIKLD